MKKTTISFDSEGLDHGYEVLLEAVLEFLRENPDLKVLFKVFILETNKVEALKLTRDEVRIELIFCAEAASTELNPKVLINDVVVNMQKSKPLFNYTMTSALFASASGQADFAMIPGHVGHAIMLARALEQQMGIFNYHLTQCICSQMYSVTSAKRIMLDLGGLIEPDLFKLAILGEAFARICMKIKAPKVGFLNIGTEKNKGTQSIREAAEKYSQAYPNSIIKGNGFIEPNHILTDKECNVVVTTGLIGNFVLKSMAGTAKTIFSVIKEKIQENLLNKILGFPLYFLLKDLKESTNPDQFNAGPILGLHFGALKLHGSSDKNGIKGAISQAMVLMGNYPEFTKKLDSLLDQKKESATS